MFKNYCNEGTNLFYLNEKNNSGIKLKFSEDIFFLNKKFNIAGNTNGIYSNIYNLDEFNNDITISDDSNYKYKFKYKTFDEFGNNNISGGIGINNMLYGIKYNIDKKLSSFSVGYNKNNFGISCNINQNNNLINSDMDLSGLYKYNNIYTAINLNVAYNKYNNMEGLIGYKTSLCDNNIKLSYDNSNKNTELVFNTEGNISNTLSLGTGIKINPTNIEKLKSDYNIIGSIKYKYDEGNINLVGDIKDKSVTSKIEHKITDKLTAGCSIKYNNSGNVSYGVNVIIS
jgi:hypothetical protein